MRMDKKRMLMARITKGGHEGWRVRGRAGEGLRASLIKSNGGGRGKQRERETLSSRPAAFGSNSVQMKNGDEIIRQAD